MHPRHGLRPMEVVSIPKRVNGNMHRRAVEEFFAMAFVHLPAMTAAFRGDQGNGRARSGQPRFARSIYREGRGDPRPFSFQPLPSGRNMAASAAARLSAFDLCTVSMYSASGSLSWTTPPPAWM